MAVTLKVRAKGASMVPNLEAQEAGVKRFVGRKYTQLASGEWAFVPEGVEELPMRGEYVRDVKEGALEPADEATAKACGVAFVSAKHSASGNESPASKGGV